MRPRSEIDREAEELVARIRAFPPDHWMRRGLEEGEARVREHTARQPFRVRVSLFIGRHLGWHFGLSLVFWLLLVALVALVALWLLPGCADTASTVQRERSAFSSAKRAVFNAGHELATGAWSEASFQGAVTNSFDGLQDSERVLRGESGTGWLEVLGIALGSSGAVGLGLHKLRNRTRRRDLSALWGEVEELQGTAAARRKGGGA